MENTANDPRCADDIAGEIWMQYPLRLWALAERNARSDSSSIILTIFKQIFTNMHTPTSQFCHRREDVVSRMRLGSGHVTSPSNKVSWNAARHRLEVDRAKLPSRQILTYSLRDERHSGLGWVREATNFHCSWWHLTLSRARAKWNVVVLSSPRAQTVI